MARQQRIQFPQAFYHVTSRGNNRQNIFLCDEDRYSLIGILGKASDRFNLHIFAFCLMGNHYHLLLRTPDANLSRAMQWINTTHTVRFNLHHKSCGHLLQGRYKSILVLDDAHWLHLSMYIHLNPVRAGIIDDPGRYEWSSFRDYTRIKPRFDWLIRDEILEHYGSNEAERARRYRKKCLALAGETPTFLNEMKSGFIIGSREKIKDLARKYKGKKYADLKRVISDYSRPEPDLKQELWRVAKTFAIDVDDITRPRRNFLPRLVAYYHLVEHCGVSSTIAARTMGVTISAIAYGVRRTNEAMRKDARLRDRINSLFAISRSDPLSR